MKKYLLFPFLLLLVGCSFKIPFTDINVDFSKEDSEILEPVLEPEVDECEYDDSADCYEPASIQNDTVVDEVSDEPDIDINLFEPSGLEEGVEFLLENSAF